MRCLLIITAIMFTSFQAFSQVYGNGQMKTITQSVEGLKNINIQFNGNIILDYTKDEVITITADENILEFIGIEFSNGKLTLDQIKWIEPSRLPDITIGCPELSDVYQGTHSKTIIRNMNASNITLEGNVGKIEADGKVDKLSVNTAGTQMDLSKLVIENAFVSVEDGSKVILNQVQNLEADVENENDLVLNSKPGRYSGNKNESNFKRQNRTIKNPNLRYIDFKVKNNSLKRNHFYVIGPKADGSRFSYGFSLLPGFSKKERWSIGTKVYKEKSMGRKELLVTISSEDEGETINLFQ